MGLIGAALAGGVQGLGEAGEKSALMYQRQQGELDIQKEMMELKHLKDVALANLHGDIQTRVHAANVKADTGEVGARIEAQTAPLVAQRKALAPVEAEAAGGVARATAQAGVDVANDPKNVSARIKAEQDAFNAMEPLKRKAAIDAEVEKVRAMATPEMLKAVRAEAQAKHIVDPAYTLVPLGDGTVATFDARSGRTTGTLNGPDGKPLIRKDPEELKAATSVINMANQNLKIAQAEYKATLSDMSGDPAVKARAEADWKNAQLEAKRLTAPAYAVLYGKAGIEEAPAAPTETTGKTGWDSATGKVFKNGKEIGTAKTEAEARKLAAGGPATQSASASAAPAQPTTQQPDIPGGADVDAARSRLAEANTKLRSFGVVQQRRDPAGFAEAKRAAAEAQQAVDAAMGTYQTNVGPVGAARLSK